MTSKSRTRMAEEDLLRVQRLVIDHLKTNAFVTNHALRKLAGITYDQAIFFFGQMLKRNAIMKIGTASSTRYTLSTKKLSE